MLDLGLRHNVTSVDANASPFREGVYLASAHATG